MAHDISPTDHRLTNFSLWLSYGTIAIAYFASIVNTPRLLDTSWLVWALLAGCLLFALIFYFGETWLADDPSFQRNILFFGALVGTAAFIMYFGQIASFWILMLLVVGRGMVMPLKASIPFGLFCFFITSALFSNASGNWDNLLANMLSVGAIFLFVMLFSFITIRAEATSAENVQLSRDLLAANEQLRAYASQVEELAITKERNRIAREIHDSLGHYLTVVNVQLEAANTILDVKPDKAKAAIRKAQQLTQEGLADVRHSVAALREASPAGSRPLTTSLTQLIDESNASGIVTNLDVVGTSRPLQPQTNLTLYRAVQEALTNVRKHANASRVDLTLDYSDADAVSLSVEDNGVGTDQTEGGFGLIGIRERVQLLRGSVAIDSGNNSGFKLTLSVPSSARREHVDPRPIG